MNIIPIETLEDARLDAYVRLTDRELRSKLEPEKALFIAESFKVIERALAAGYQIKSLLAEEKWLPHIEELDSKFNLAEQKTPIFIGEHEMIEKLCGYEVTRGALAAFSRPELARVTELIKDAHRIAVLENINNHTNIGAIFRSAAALGVDAVLISPSCLDPFYRRALRVSMGTICQVPWTRIGESPADWPEKGIQELKDAGFYVVALALTDHALNLDDPCLKTHDKLAFILGNEGEGLTSATIQKSDACAIIPMSHEVDSLNVAAASAVAFWEFARHS